MRIMLTQLDDQRRQQLQPYCSIVYKNYMAVFITFRKVKKDSSAQ